MPQLEAIHIADNSEAFEHLEAHIWHVIAEIQPDLLQMFVETGPPNNMASLSTVWNWQSSYFSNEKNYDSNSHYIMHELWHLGYGWICF